MVNELKLSENVFARTFGQTTHVVHIRPKIPIEIEMENTNRISFVSHMFCRRMCVGVVLRILWRVPKSKRNFRKTGYYHHRPGQKYHAHGITHTHTHISHFVSCVLSLSNLLSFDSIPYLFISFLGSKTTNFSGAEMLYGLVFVLVVSLIFNVPFAWVNFRDFVCWTYAFTQMLAKFFFSQSLCRSFFLFFSSRKRQSTIFMMHKLNK